MAQTRGNGFVGRVKEEQLARGLGWFSLGLGLAKILAPRSLGRTIGVGEHPTLMRLIGLRELACGVGILTQKNPSDWLWARVGGDLMDVALLGIAFTSEDSKPSRIAAATAAVAGVARIDMSCSQQLSQNPGANIRAIHVTRAITIDRSPEELFQFWRNFENLPRFMNHLKSVEVKSDTRSHWVAKGPANSDIEWDAEIVNEHRNEMIAWQSCEGADVENAGSVRFTPATGGRGTVVKVELKYDPPAGVLGATVARLFGEAPEKQIAIDLGRLKQFLETGEIARTEGQAAGRKKSTSRKYDELVRSGA
jgi:uncharacterized membrane protein